MAELPPLRDVIRELGLSAKKSLGQNFILDLNLTARIARSAGPLDGVTVVEIGPGPGGLTRALISEGAAKVIAVEKDPRFLPALEAIADHWPGRLAVVEADALSVDWALLVPPSETVRIVANLPYGSRHAAAHRLAEDRALAALVGSHGVDVPA